MQYNRVNIDKLLNEYKDAVSDDIALINDAMILKAKGRKCIFIRREKMLKIIALQNQITELKQKSEI